MDIPKPNLEPSCDACVGVREEKCQAITQESSLNFINARSLGRLMNIARPEESERANAVAKSIREGTSTEYKQKMRTIGCILTDTALQIKLLDRLGE